VTIIGRSFLIARLIDSFDFRLNAMEGKMRIVEGEKG
jgi:hypothetical protein